MGRFQPFHIGHLAAVQFALKKVKILYVVVGSAEKDHQANNPFTSSERIRMIEAALDNAGIDCHRYIIVPIPDARTHSLWLGRINCLVPKYDVVFSNDPLTLRLFQEMGVKVLEVVYYKREFHSATEVRRRMAEGGKWEKLVPNPVAKIIREIDGVQRIRAMVHTVKKDR